MKFKKTKAVALILTAALVGGTMSGCAFVTTDVQKDLAQTIAEVDISQSVGFSEEFPGLADSIDKSTVLKRDLVAGFASYGSTYVNSYNMSQEEVYKLIRNQLVNREIFLQYAQLYYYRNSDKTAEGRKTAIENAEEKDKAIAGLRYFLDEDEIEMAEYQVKRTFNSTLDSQEVQFIKAEEDEHDHDEARTTPTGVDAVNEDYYDTAYAIYTGKNAAANCGSYEVQTGSTPTTRQKAYKALLANLSFYGLISQGEDTSDISALSYYTIERKTQYETQLIDKLMEDFEAEAEKDIKPTTGTEEEKKWVENKFADTLANQKSKFDASASDALSALNDASDTSFVLYAPSGYEGYSYGYVINILLPFNNRQKLELSDAHNDFGDSKGNKFVKRTALLQGVLGSDQRGTWFTGHENYAFDSTKEDGVNAFTNGDSSRKYLFFKNNLIDSVATGKDPAQYDPLKNYYGYYTYNGYAAPEAGEEEDSNHYVTVPNKLDINGFIDEMEKYAAFAGIELTGSKTENYFDMKVEDFYNPEDNTVDYEKFIYYVGHINWDGEYDPNHIFQKGEKENIAFSVMKELSFAYNTDTAGLNEYFGYAVTPNKTEYMTEFEVAAQEAIKQGAGTVTIAPTDYGWHIMYCPLAYNMEGNTPFEFRWDEVDIEGTFSNLYYNALKADAFDKPTSDRQSLIINKYNNSECVSLYIERYKDLYEA